MHTIKNKIVKVIINKSLSLKETVINLCCIIIATVSRN